MYTKLIIDLYLESSNGQVTLYTIYTLIMKCFSPHNSLLDLYSKFKQYMGEYIFVNRNDFLKLKFFPRLNLY